MWKLSDIKYIAHLLCTHHSLPMGRAPRKSTAGKANIRIWAKYTKAMYFQKSISFSNISSYSDVSFWCGASSGIIRRGRQRYVPTIWEIHSKVIYFQIESASLSIYFSSTQMGNISKIRNVKSNVAMCPGLGIAGGRCFWCYYSFSLEKRNIRWLTCKGVAQSVGVDLDKWLP